MQFLRRSNRSDSLWLLAFLPAVLALLVALTGQVCAMRPVQHRLEELTFAILERPASGQIHVVEMDAASIAAIRRWPWSREHYARLVEQLDAAGVRSISFDVDFSSASEPAQDAAFAAAIAAARAPVVLPTFAQPAAFREERKLESEPIAPLREHASLASVSVAPDPDGFVRRMPLGTVTGSLPRPSIAAFAAGRAGHVGASVPIDFAIDPATIPRHSFIAIERGAFDPALLRGKDVIIGATAIEMGDRYPVPRHGVIHGVFLQALAAETLLGGVPTYGSSGAPLALALILAFAVGAAQGRRTVLVRAGLAASALAASWLAARLVFDLWFEIVPALVLIALVAGLRLAILTRRYAEYRRRIDAETGLPNQRALEARTDNAARHFIAAQIGDFDALKLAVGPDQVGELMRRLVDRLQVAGGADEVFRIDTRTLVWPSPLDLDELEPLLAGMRAVMRSPFEVAGKRLGVPLTFGVARADGAASVENAIHAASLARRSGNPWRLHAADEEAAASDQFALLGDLDEAIAAGRIVVLYQPKLNLVTGRIDSAEALVRWNHPQRGMLPPDSFIPAIEEAGRIDALTIAVAARVIEDMRSWAASGLDIGVAINVSARLLNAHSFVERTLALIAGSGVPAERLTIEVTESAQFSDTDEAVRMLRRFRESGVRISMDDYGTGHSSLNYLKLLPLSELKIDRMFVQHAHHDHSDAMMVRSTVQLAHELGIKVVAEGIEDAECLAFLKSIECDHAQGYFIGRAMSAETLTEYVAAPQPLAA